MSVQKFLGTIETDGIKDEMGIETPSLSATGEVSGKTGVFSESVTAPVFNGKATSAGSADNATNATNDGAGSNIANTYATKAALAEETSAREAADETLSKGITAEATARAEEISALQTSLTSGGITVANATNATNIKAKDETYKALVDALLEMVYPIGSIYMSVSNVSPQSFLGGTWVAWGSGRVPVGVDTSQTQFATVEQTGGEVEHTLIVDEMPSHAHSLYEATSATSGIYSVVKQGTSALSESQASYGVSGSTGGGQAHNNLQPYITCYMWKRTA